LAKPPGRTGLKGLLVNNETRRDTLVGNAIHEMWATDAIRAIGTDNDICRKLLACGECRGPLLDVDVCDFRVRTNVGSCIIS
jgi:hypothetical protein